MVPALDFTLSIWVWNHLVPCSLVADIDKLSVIACSLVVQPFRVVKISSSFSLSALPVHDKGRLVSNNFWHSRSSSGLIEALK